MSQADTPTLKLTQRDRASLSQMSEGMQRLIGGMFESPEAAAILRSQDEHKAERRRALIKERAALLEAAQRLDPKLLRQAEDLAAEVCRLEAALPAARDALVQARAALDNSKNRNLALAYAIERKLRGDRDERLLDFRLQLSGVMGGISERFEVTEIRVPRNFFLGGGHATEVRTNAAEVTAARDACQAIYKSTFDAETEADTFDQLTDRLRRWADELAPVLAELKLRPPRVLKVTGEVKAPLHWDVVMNDPDAA